MKTYHINYKLHNADKERCIQILAESKMSAYDKAVFEIIPQIEGESPYSVWVCSVTYKNGKCKLFNTSEGNPY